MNPTPPVVPLRIVLAKVGLDGHDRGVKVVARGLRDAGFHVIYAGLWQTPEAVVRTVADEDAAWLGLSLLSGAHMTLVPRVLQLLREAGLVEFTVDAQRRLYRLRHEPLEELDTWLAPFRRFWSTHVDALERHLDHMEQSAATKRKTRRRR